jgi:phosphonoacetaldehyde hydrolase
MGIKGVIFDWAGTTVDYGCIAPAIVFVEVFKNKNIQITIEEARGSMGLAKKDHVRALIEHESVKQQWHQIFGRYPDETDVEVIYAELEQSLVSIVAKYSVPVPGIVELVKTLKNRGIKIGTTTGYTAPMMKNVIKVAKELGFEPDCIINSSDVNEGRPKPWMAFLNAIKLDIYPPSSIIKVGDTVADIKEGINAGMWTIGVTKSGNEVGFSLDEIKKVDKQILDSKIEKARQKLLDAGAHFVIEGVWECLPIIDKIEKLIQKGEKP